MEVNKEELRRLTEKAAQGVEKVSPAEWLEFREVSGKPSTILGLLDELEQMTNNRDMWREQCSRQSATLSEARDNERQAMAYLHEVREIIGGHDFPAMVRNVQAMGKDAGRWKWLEGSADGATWEFIGYQADMNRHLHVDAAMEKEVDNSAH